MEGPGCGESGGSNLAGRRVIRIVFHGHSVLGVRWLPSADMQNKHPPASRNNTYASKTHSRLFNRGEDAVLLSVYLSAPATLSPTTSTSSEDSTSGVHNDI